MKFIPKHPYGTRRERMKFLWFPTRVEYSNGLILTVWLEKVKVVEEFVEGAFSSFWQVVEYPYV